MGEKAYKINFLGWNTDGTSDKVWGFMTVGEGKSAGLYNFWGARTKTLAFKVFKNDWSNMEGLEKLAKKKSAKGYTKVSEADLEEAEAGWIDSFEKQYVIAKMFDKFHNKVDENLT